MESQVIAGGRRGSNFSRTDRTSEKGFDWPSDTSLRKPILEEPDVRGSPEGDLLSFHCIVQVSKLRWGYGMWEAQGPTAFRYQYPTNKREWGKKCTEHADTFKVNGLFVAHIDQFSESRFASNEP